MDILLTTDLFFHPLTYKPTYHQWLFEILKPALTSVPSVDRVDMIHEVIDEWIAPSQLPARPYEPLTGARLEMSHERAAEMMARYQLTVVFEASRETREWLIGTGLPVLFLYIHPVRFSDDMVFSAWSTDEAIVDALKEHAVPESELHALGRYWRELLMRKLPPLDTSDSPAVLIGQTSTDMSIWNGERMVNLGDFEERIDEICSKHDAVFYSAHPLDRITNDTFIRSKPRIRSTSENTYRWLAQEGVTVYAISSSVVEESFYFGAKGEYLWQPLFNVDGTFVPLGRQVFSSRLWRRVLGAEPLPQNTEDLFVHSNGSLIRDITDAYWSLPFLNDVKAGRFPRRRSLLGLRKR